MNTHAILEKEHFIFEGAKLNDSYLTNPVCKKGS